MGCRQYRRILRTRYRVLRRDSCHLRDRTTTHRSRNSESPPHSPVGRASMPGRNTNRRRCTRTPARHRCSTRRPGCTPTDRPHNIERLRRRSGYRRPPVSWPDRNTGRCRRTWTVMETAECSSWSRQGRRPRKSETVGKEAHCISSQYSFEHISISPKSPNAMIAHAECLVENAAADRKLGGGVRCACKPAENPDPKDPRHLTARGAYSQSAPLRCGRKCR